MFSHLKDVIVLTGLDITQAYFRLLHKKKFHNLRKEK